MEARRAHIEILDGPRHVELVYCADNNAGSREEGEQDEEEQVDHQVSQEPAKSSHREIVPIRQERQNRLKRGHTSTAKFLRKLKQNLHICIVAAPFKCLFIRINNMSRQ